MSGKPHKLHLKDNAIPYAAHSPIPVPHYWKEEIKQQLDKDVEWCMRKVPVAKGDGKPRRTFDFLE